MEPIALALGLDDLAAVGEAVEGGAAETFRAKHLGPGNWNGRFVVTIRLVSTVNHWSRWPIEVMTSNQASHRSRVPAMRVGGARICRRNHAAHAA